MRIWIYLNIKYVIILGLISLISCSQDEEYIVARDGFRKAFNTQNVSVVISDERVGSLLDSKVVRTYKVKIVRDGLKLNKIFYRVCAGISATISPEGLNTIDNYVIHINNEDTTISADEFRTLDYNIKFIESIIYNIENNDFEYMYSKYSSTLKNNKVAFQIKKILDSTAQVDGNVKFAFFSNANLSEIKQSVNQSKVYYYDITVVREPKEKAQVVRLYIPEKGDSIVNILWGTVSK